MEAHFERSKFVSIHKYVYTLNQGVIEEIILLDLNTSEKAIQINFHVAEQ